MGFADLKKNRNNFDKLSKLMDGMDKKQSYTDDRFWYPKKDKAGNAYAVIRFLPEADGEDQPFVAVYSHAFKGPNGRWYIENCPTTIGRDDCPVCKAGTLLWNSGIESDKEIVRARKRKLNYISNVYVISDPASPENNGTIKLFKYGKKVMDKINAARKPEFPSDPKFNPFAFWEGTDEDGNTVPPGADFELKVRQVEGYPNYEKCVFKQPTEFMGGDDKKLETIWKQQYKLAEFIDPANFKPAHELEKKFAVATGRSATQSNSSSAAQNSHEEVPVMAGGGDDESSEAMDFYRKLADEA